MSVQTSSASSSAWKEHGAADLNRGALGVERLHTFGRHFVDGYGRVVQLRGMNVSGSSKLPTKPNPLSTPLTAEQFFAHDSVSFEGRPFPLSEAPLHFARLQAWGHTLVRLLITWESLSHAGPNPDNDMDKGYIDYLDQLIGMMPTYGLKVVLCAHQDVWSRFSGGSGAPAWTFEKAGLDIEAFKPTGAAFIPPLDGDAEARFSGAHEPKTKKREPVGAFVWPSGYQKLAAATMSTLFWAGDIYAWNLQLDSFDEANSSKISIQDYLQSSYIETFGRLIDRLGGKEAVMGVDLINEPHRGYVGLKDWHKWCYETDLHIGHFPSLLQSLALGSGHKQDVPFFIKSWPFPTRRTHMSTVDPLGRSAWHTDAGMGECVWRAHGAWQWDTQKQQPVVLCDDFFSRDPRPGKEKARIEWYRDCYAPFVKRFSERLTRKHKHLFSFVEPIPNEFFPPWSHASKLAQLDDRERILLMKSSFDQTYATKTYIEDARPAHFVYAPHFYDLNVLFSKHHGNMSVDVQSLSRGGFILKSIFFDVDGLKKNYNRQLDNLVQYGKISFGSVPTIVGEVGVPFDINGGHALRTGDYAKQTELLDALIEAMEQAEVGFTLWNYNPDNTVKDGDGWNQEDFSVMCAEKQALDVDNVCAPGGERGDIDLDLYRLHVHGRALPAIIRPYATKVAGFPAMTEWDVERRMFTFCYINPPLTFHEDFLRSSGFALDDPRAMDEARTTKMYVPRFHFDGYSIEVQVLDGEYDLSVDRQTLSVKHANLTPGYTHKIRIIAGAPLPAEKMTASQAALMRNREAVRQRRHKWIRLGVNDWFGLLAVFFGVLATLALSRFASHMLMFLPESHIVSNAVEGAGLS